MDKTYSMDGVQAILSYPFKAPGWQSKFLIAAALYFANNIIPILPGIALVGYSAKIMRDIIVENAVPTLPEWEDWGSLFSRGFKVFCATFVYMLPVILLMVGGYVLMIIPIFLMDASSASSYGAAGSTVGLYLLGIFGGLLLFLFGFVLSIPLTFIMPPAIAHMVAKDSFPAAFRVTEWWAILRANLWGFFTALVVVNGVYVLIVLFIYLFYFTIILCILVPIAFSLALPYMSAISSVTIGQAYRKGVENLATETAK